jgi:hypothetical protein
VDPLPPTINLNFNATYIFPTQWTRITATCVAGSGNVSQFWYNNPFDDQNYTLATDIQVLDTQFLDFTSLTPDTFIFQFWAISALGLPAERSITVVWNIPTPPSITINASTLAPTLGKFTEFTITVRAGSGIVDTVWWYNPTTGENETLGENFVGEQTYTKNASSSILQDLEFIVWANSSYLAEASESITISWVEVSGFPSWIIWMLVGIIGAVAAVFLAYQLYFSVPKTIRTIRKTKGQIRKGKEMEELKIPQRGETVYHTFNKALKVKKVPTKKPEAPEVIQKVKKPVS